MSEKRVCSIFRNDEHNWYLITALVFSVVWPLAILWPHLTDWYRVPIDTQNFYWMAKFQDPTLFPDDRLQIASQLVDINIFGREVLLYPVSLGYGLLFFVASFLINPIVFAKLLVFFLMPLTVWYLFKLAKAVRASNTKAFVLGVLFVFLNLTASDATSLASGLQRAFALPLLIIFAYYMQQARYPTAASFIPITALIYIPNMPLLVIVYLLSMLKTFKLHKPAFRNGMLRPLFIYLLITLPIIAWVVMTKFHIVSADKSSTLVREAQDLRFLFHGFPWLGRTSFFVMLEEVITFLVLVVLSFMIGIVVQKEHWYSIPKVFIRLLIAGFVMYFMALVAIFFFSSTALYLPSRYSRVALFMAAFSFVGLNLDTFFMRLPQWFHANRKKVVLIAFLCVLGLWILGSKNLTAFFLVAAGFAELFIILLTGLSGLRLLSSKTFFEGSIFAIFTIISLFVGGMYTRMAGYRTINPTTEQRMMYNYIKTLPKDVVLSGSPDILTGIPLFSKRAVLFKSLHPDRSAPIVDAMSAYYAEETSEIIKFCQQHDVDYLVWNQRDYSQEFLQEGDFFSLPYQEEIRDQIFGRDDFVLLQVEPEYRVGYLGLVKCEENLFSQ